jgi:hypothetical protein|tara:strand:- start:1540 stop:1926 length:387 start_codon:yes stop_codon:yes gene_type:complete
MAVTNDNIRDVLNRPRGLNEGTITELLSIRTNEVNKVARGTLYGVGASEAPSTDLKEGAIKMLVALDCLNILIDTVPSYYSEEQQRVYDRRFQQQILTFQQRADEALALITDLGTATFATGNSKTRLV